MPKQVITKLSHGRLVITHALQTKEFSDSVHNNSSSSRGGSSNNNNNNSASSSTGGAAAEMAATRKMAKYADLPASYLLQPVALETLGPINDSAVDFLSELGSRIGTASGESASFSSRGFP